MGFFNQLGLLIWKNFTIRRRQKLRLAVEIIWPLVLFIVLILVRTRGLQESVPECHLTAKALPSAGTIPFLQSLVCQYNNTCYAKERRSETPSLSPFSDATFTKLTDGISELLRDSSSRSQLESLVDSAGQLTQGAMQLNPQSLLSVGQFALLVTNVMPSIQSVGGQLMQSPSGRKMQQALAEVMQAMNASTGGSGTASTAAMIGLFCGKDNDLSAAAGGTASPASSSVVSSSNPGASAIMNSAMPSDGAAPSLNLTALLLLATKNYNSSAFSKNDSYCRALFGAFNSTASSRLIWQQVSPMLLGKLLFTPNDTTTNAIVRMANRTFASLASVQFLADQWVQASPKLRQMLSSNAALISLFSPSGASSSSTTDLLDSLDTGAMVVARTLGCFELNKFQAVATEDKLVSLGLDLIGTQRYWAGLVFTNTTDGQAAPRHLKYKIRMDSSKVDSTKSVRDRLWQPGVRRSPATELKYFTFGFAFAQDMVEQAIIEYHTGNDSRFGVVAQQMPYPCYINDKFVTAISGTLPLFLIIGWIYFVSMLVKSIVTEKEKRLKEIMRVMGLGNGVHWIAWFLDSLFVMAIVCFILALIAKYGRIIAYADLGLVFVYFLSFTFSTITLCFFLSTLFDRANLAAVCGGFIYFIMYLPYTFLLQWEEKLKRPQYIVAGLLSPVSFGFGCNYMAKYEQQGTGVRWNTMSKPVSPDDQFTFSGCLAMLIFDGFLYWFLAWYVEAVFPGEFGIPRRFYFLFTPSYWCGESHEPSNERSADNVNNLELAASNHVESEPTHLPLGVSILNLHKVYKRGKKVAVDGLSINFYEGQITSFLGHNGAGKTTTMSILTGLYPATSGTAKIYGRDIRSDFVEIRKGLGFAPQYNVLFDSLTVEEHMWFYARLKGRDNGEIEAEIRQMIEDVGLSKKRREPPSSLSGGMKRKLSIAIAFLGGSKTVILDEPTAGVDPYARRGIWDLLTKYKEGRTIILSTHHMDEADILGDRIAIISQGKLCCCGTSLFLKSRYGGFYYLTLVKANPTIMANQQSDTSNDFEKQADDDHKPNTQSPEMKVTAFLRSSMPETRLVEEGNTELHYAIPSTDGRLAKFTDMLQSLHDNMAQLEISSYGLHDSTLEEIFLKVAEETGVDEDHSQKKDLGRVPTPVTRSSIRRRSSARPASASSVRPQSSLKSEKTASTHQLVNGSDPNLASDPDSIDLDMDYGAGSKKIDGMALKRQQFLALWVKRFHHVRRSKKGFVSEIILPAVFVCLAMVVATIVPSVSFEPPLELHPWVYETPNYVFVSNDNSNANSATDSVVQALLSSPGLGTRCIKNNQIDKLTCSAASVADFKQPTVADNVQKALDNSNYSLTGISPDCNCKSGYQDCSESPAAGGPPPPSMQLESTDTMENVTGRNLSDWIVKTMLSSPYFRHRFGGFSLGSRVKSPGLSGPPADALLDRFAASSGLANNPNGQAIADNFKIFMRAIDSEHAAKVWFDNKAWVSSVAYMNVISNAMLRSRLSSSQGAANEFGITLINHPLNYTTKQLETAIQQSGAVDILIAICVIFAMSFIPASFVLYFIMERVSNSKHLQFVSGVNPVIYWCAGFSWDMLNYLVSATICIFIFLAFQKDAYVSHTNFPVTLLLLLLYGWSITPMMYPAVYIFSTPSTAFVALSCLNVFLGIVSTVATFTLDLFKDDKDLLEINDYLKRALLVLPHYCLGRGLMDLSMTNTIRVVQERLGQTTTSDPFAWETCGRNIVAMAICGFLAFALNLLIEYRFFVKPGKVAIPEKDSADDEDVAAERQRALQGKADNDILVAKNLSKMYDKGCCERKGFFAVNRLCFGVRKGECFGLLGVNGAGKTTTFKMLTSELSPSEGDAQVSGYSVRSQQHDVHKYVGYCPQFDAIDELVSGREHLEFYARLRGVPWKEVPQVAGWAVKKLGLINYKDKLAGDYSGGNKRKLSTAIALIGNPQLIFLDEPTTGMDPKARRFLWNCIEAIVREGRSVVLTSHSMEECEALCNRLSIMVNGEFKCIGSIQHLKNRFGGGYTVTLRVKGNAPNLQPVKALFASQFPDARIQEEHFNMVQYHLSNDNLHLPTVFGLIESAKPTLGIEEYSVNQTTLDQVFINFAKNQTDGSDTTLDEPVAQPLSHHANTGVPNGVSNGVPNGVSNGGHKGIPNGVPNGTHNGAFNGGDESLFIAIPRGDEKTAESALSRTEDAQTKALGDDVESGNREPVQPVTVSHAGSGGAGSATTSKPLTPVESTSPP